MRLNIVKRFHEVAGHPYHTKTNNPNEQTVYMYQGI